MAQWKDGLRQGADGLWYCRFKMDGRLFQECTGQSNRNKAVAWRNAYRARISDGDVGVLSAPTLEQAWGAMLADLEDKVSANQVARLRGAERYFLPKIGALKADQVTADHINAVLKAYLEAPSDKPMHRGKAGKKHTKHGANTLLRILRQPFNYLVKRGYLKCVPWDVQEYEVAEPHRAYVPVELTEAFFKAIDKPRNLHAMLAIRAMFWLGLRESEALEMRWEGFRWDLKRYAPGSTRYDETKGKEVKGLPTDQGMRALLWAIIWEDFNGTRPLAGWTIPAGDGAPHRQGFTKKAIARAGKEIRIPGLTPHRMRASYATNLARTGHGAHHIKEALRHKDISTSEHYVRLGEEDLVDGLEALKKRAYGA